jgi:acyl-CoA thioesterase
VAEPAPGTQAPPGAFERDTAVTLLSAEGTASEYAATVGDEWRAGRGPHGGYLAAIILRALTISVGDAARAPRSLTIHYARAPKPGPVTIRTVRERDGRSLSTLSARMEQDGNLVAIALAAFSLPWDGPELSDIRMPNVDGPDAERIAATGPNGGPLFMGHLILQPRIEPAPPDGTRRRMEFAAWLGLAEARGLDALALAFFSDALIPAPFLAIGMPAPAPTIDLTIHFRVALPLEGEPDPYELCFARVHAGLVHDGFFEEDSTIWSADGTLLAQSRQLAILMGPPASG